jgi:hypothetical protein
MNEMKKLEERAPRIVKLPYRKKAAFCKMCGHKLSSWNMSKFCFHHKEDDIEKYKEKQQKIKAEKKRQEKEKCQK